MKKLRTRLSEILGKITTGSATTYKIQCQAVQILR